MGLVGGGGGGDEDGGGVVDLVYCGCGDEGGEEEEEEGEEGVGEEGAEEHFRRGARTGEKQKILMGLRGGFSKRTQKDRNGFGREANGNFRVEEVEIRLNAAVKKITRR